ncbi:unnamed protein product [Rhodiola kirilowii]
MGSRRGDFGDGASPGKIFIGGLAKDTTLETFVEYFEKYGQLTDSVIMKDRLTGKPRGFGFITYADPAVVDIMIEETHVINGKQVEIKRTIPKGAALTNDFKTKKIFVGGLPVSVTEEDFKDFFSKYGKVVEHEIIIDHATKRSRGFGFIVFDNEQIVDRVLSNGNMIDMAGSKVEIKKAEPKKASKPAPGLARGSEYRSRAYKDEFKSFGEPYSGFGRGDLGPIGLDAAPYRSLGGFGSRYNDYGGYVGGGIGSEFGGSYGGIGSGSGFRGEPYDYPRRLGSYGGGGYGGGAYGSGAYGSSGLGSFGRGLGGGVGYGSYGPPGSGSAYGYDSGPGPTPSYGGVGGLYGRGGGGYGAGSRYHPYSR